MSDRYRELLKDPRWKVRRAQIIARDGGRCVQCGGDVGGLQVDHKRYIAGAMPWESPDEDLQTLCAVHHEQITVLRARLRDSTGEADAYRLAELIDVIEGRPFHAHRPLMYVLERLNRERDELIAELNAERSRRLASIDSDVDGIWSFLERGARQEAEKLISPHVARP